jgi:hypothetical protein
MMQQAKCLAPTRSGDFALFDCPRCGSFALSGTAESALERMLTEMPLRRSLMSRTLGRMQRPDKKHLHVIQTDEIPTFLAGAAAAITACTS